MSQQIAALTAYVGADVTSFRSAMHGVRQDLFDIGGLSSGLRSLGTDLTYAITAPIIGGLAAATAVFAGFEGQMRNVASIAPEVAADFYDASEAIQALGINSVNGATAMAQALYAVQSAGFGLHDFNEALQVTEQASHLAEAGLSDLGATATALVATLNAYSQGASSAEHYSDVLANTVALGVGDMNGLIHSMAQVLPSAVGLGISIDDLGGNLAYLTQRSFSWATASTSLNNAMTRLITPTDEMAAIFEQLGVGSGRELITTFGGVGQALQAIYNVIGDDPELLHRLFPDIRGFRAMLLAFSDMEGYTGVMQEFADTVDGATSRQREEQLKSFNTQISLLGSAFQALGINIGEVVAPVIVPFITAIKDAIVSVAELNPMILAFGIAVAVVVAAIPPLILLAGTLLTPLGALVAVVAGIGALFVSNFDMIVGWVNANAPTVVTAIEGVVEAVRNMIRFMTDDMSVMGSIAPVLGADSPLESWGMRLNDEGVWERYELQGILQGGEGAINDTRDLGTRMSQAWGLWGQTIIDSVSGAIHTVIEWVQTDGVVLFDEIVSGIFNGIGAAFAGTSNATRGAGAENIGLVEGIFGGLEGIGTGIAGAEALFPQIGAAINGMLQNFSDWFANEGLPAAALIAGSIVGAIGAAIVTLAEGVFGGAKSANGVNAEEIRLSFETGLNNMLGQLEFEGGARELAARVVGAVGVALLVLNLAGGSAGGLILKGLTVIGTFIFTKLLSLISYAFAPTVALIASAIADKVMFALWSVKYYLVTAGAQAFGYLAGLIMAGISGAISTLSAVALSPVGAAIGGVLAGLAIWNLLPEDIRTKISNFVQGIFTEIAAAILSVDTSVIQQNLEDILTLMIATPLSDWLSMFGIETGVDELVAQTEARVNASLNTPIEVPVYVSPTWTLTDARNSYLNTSEFNPELAPLQGDVMGGILRQINDSINEEVAPAFRRIPEEADKSATEALNTFGKMQTGINTEFVMLNKNTGVNLIGFSKVVADNTSIALATFTTFKDGMSTLIGDLINRFNDMANAATGAITAATTAGNLPPAPVGGGGSDGTEGLTVGEGGRMVQRNTINIYTNEPTRIAREMQRTGVITGVGLVQL